MPETTTKAKPILFSAPMVNAILAGTKTQTRRAVKPQPPGDYICLANPERITRSGVGVRPDQYFCDNGTGKSRAVVYSDGSGRNYDTGNALFCPYGQLGDILYVKEALVRDVYGLTYKADDADVEVPVGCGWKCRLGTISPIHMPRWASRITLEITDVRVQRVRDISEEDAKAEGIRPIDCGGSGPNHWTDGTHNAPTAKEVYRELWGSISGWDSWDANPWCWCISFRRITNA